jgi:hypothetical protein
MLARQRYAQRGRGLQSGTAPWAPIRIHVHEGTFDSSLSSATRTYLTGQLLPAAIDWLHHALCTPQDRSFSASPPLLHARSVAATFARPWPMAIAPHTLPVSRAPAAVVPVAGNFYAARGCATSHSPSGVCSSASPTPMCGVGTNGQATASVDASLLGELRVCSSCDAAGTCSGCTTTAGDGLTASRIRSRAPLHPLAPAALSTPSPPSGPRRAHTAPRSESCPPLLARPLLVGAAIPRPELQPTS